MAARVLIVDDAAFMRMMLRDILTKNGYEIAGEAPNGAVGVEKYKETQPDLVTMDITMPEMDGITAVKEIKKLTRRRGSSCAAPWASRPWSSRPSRPGPGISSSNPSSPNGC